MDHSGTAISSSVSASIAQSRWPRPVCHLATVEFPLWVFLEFVLWFFPKALWLCCAVQCQDLWNANGDTNSGQNFELKTRFS